MARATTETTGTTPPSPANYEIKALSFRGYLAQIEKLGALADVKAKVRPETLRAMEAPPLPSAWMDAMLIEDMISALESVRGMHAVRTVTKAGQEAVTLPNARPIVTGLLRLFGATPATLLSRWPDFAKTVSRGIQFHWVLDAPNSGHLTLVFPRSVPRSVYVSFESGCSLMLDLCGAKGRVSPTEISNEGRTGTIRVTW